MQYSPQLAMFNIHDFVYIKLTREFLKKKNEEEKLIVEEIQIKK